MALITLPSGLKFKKIAWRLVSPAQVNKSPWSAGRRVVIIGAHVFRVKAETLPFTRESQFRPVRSFLWKLKGRANTFRMPALNIDPQPSGNPTVNGAVAAGATSLPTAGGHTALDGHFATVPLAGGKFQLVGLTANLVANGTMSFEPPLRAPAVNGGTIELLEPFGEVAMDVDDHALSEGLEGQQFAPIAFEAEEAWDN